MYNLNLLKKNVRVPIKNYVISNKHPKTCINLYKNSDFIYEFNGAYNYHFNKNLLYSKNNLLLGNPNPNEYKTKFILSID